MLLLTINLDAWIALVYMRCVWYLLIPRKSTAQKSYSLIVDLRLLLHAGSRLRSRNRHQAAKYEPVVTFMNVYMHERITSCYALTDISTTVNMQRVIRCY